MHLLESSWKIMLYIGYFGLGIQRLKNKDLDKFTQPPK